MSASIRVGMLLLRIMENVIAFFEKLEIFPIWLLEELFLPIAAFLPPSSYCLKTSSSIESFLMSLSKFFSSLYLRQAFFHDSLYSPLNFIAPCPPLGGIRGLRDPHKQLLDLKRRRLIGNRLDVLASRMGFGDTQVVG